MPLLCALHSLLPASDLEITMASSSPTRSSMKASARGVDATAEPAEHMDKLEADAPASVAEPGQPVPESASPPAPAAPITPIRDDETRSLSTEKPMIPSGEGKQTAVYVVTVDNNTGIATRIERLDEQSGERTELSPKEYTQLMASHYAGAAGAMGQTNVLLQAYWQGMNDYFGARA